jgi:hypothetical protein
MPFYALPSGASPVLSGTAPPTGGIGTDGDLFLDRTNKVLYGPKAAGSWPTGVDLSNGLPGPTGVAGPTGIGPTGPTGIGPTGPTGVYAFSATGATAPTGGAMSSAGAVWLNTQNGRYYVRYDSSFIEIGAQGEQGRFPFFATGPTAPTAPTGAAWLDTSNGKYFLKHQNAFIEVGVQGERGPTGPTGSSFTYRGSWFSLTQYFVNDVVLFVTSSYVCRVNAFGAVQFPGNASFWSIMASGSATGPVGATGAASSVTGPGGPTGPAGPSGAASSVTGPQGPTGPAGNDRGVNRATITGNVTLQSNAAEWQILTPTGNAFDVILPTGIPDGFDVKILNADNVNFYYFDIKTPDGVSRGASYFGSGAWFLWDGQTWRSFLLYGS